MTPYLEAVRHRAFLFQARRRTGVHRLAAFGAHSVIVPPATILAPHRIEIGDRVLVFEHSNFSVVEEHNGRRFNPRLRIGDDTIIAHSVWFSCVGEIEVGSEVLIGHGVLIADSYHEYVDCHDPIIRQPMAEPAAVRIGAGACIGPGAAVLCGSTIGAGAYVAANAVVAGDVPPHSVLAGNPGELIRRWDAEREQWIDSPDPRWSGLLRALVR